MEGREKEYKKSESGTKGAIKSEEQRKWKKKTDDRKRRNGERGSQKRKEEKRRQVVKIKPRKTVGTHGWKELQRNKKADD